MRDCVGVTGKYSIFIIVQCRSNFNTSIQLQICQMPSSEASLQVCTPIVGRMISQLPGLLVFGSQQIIDTMLQAETNVARENSKVEPTTNIAQSLATAGNTAAWASAPATIQNSFQTRSQSSRTTLIAAYDTAWAQFQNQASLAIANRAPTDPSLAALNTQLLSLCATLQESLDTALNAARTDNNNLINEAAALHITTKRYQAQCFQAVQLWLTVRRFDIALAQAVPVLVNTLSYANQAQRNALAFQAVSTRYQITIGSSATKAADLALVDTALATFAPNATTNDIQTAISSAQAAFQLQVNNLVSTTVGLAEAINTIANEYCTSVDQSVQQMQETNTAQYTQAVQNMLSVIPST